MVAGQWQKKGDRLDIAIVNSGEVPEIKTTSKLLPLAGGLYAAQAGTEMKPTTDSVVQQGYLEGSNVAPLREMVDLVSISRAYEANQKLIQSRDGIMQKTLDEGVVLRFDRFPDHPGEQQAHCQL